MQGDAASDGTLLSGGIRRAAGTVLCINNDASNVNIALAARELNPEMYIVARGSDPAIEYRLLRAGADTVVYPLRLGGEQIAQVIARHGAKEVEAGQVPEQGAGDVSASVMGYQLRLFRNHGEPRSVAQVMETRRAVRAVAVHRQDGSMEHDPAPDEVLGENDALLVLANESLRQKMQRDLLPIEWTEDLTVGIGMVDDEHRLLFQYARSFQDSVLEGRGPEAVARLFDQLVEYTSTHFRHEEEFMAKHQYPALEAHKKQHRELVRQVMELNRDKRYIFSDDVWDFLDNWLRNHIMRMDRGFAAFLANKDGADAQ